MSTDNLGDDLAELSHLLRVVADEKRLRILALLARQEMCVCDITEQLRMGQSLVSHHLGVLRQVGLVQDRRDAQWIYYSIGRRQLAELNARYLALLDVATLAAEATYGTSPRKC
jgi:ArsR family transcriptional regulator